MPEVTYEKIEGFVFLHLDFKEVSPSLIKHLRGQIKSLRTKFAGQGYDVVFVTTENERVVKFWGLITPCYKIQSLGGHGYIGSWLTEDEE